MARTGRASSSRSNNSSSTPVALRENTLKLMPPSTTVAPRGQLLPALATEFMTAASPYCNSWLPLNLFGLFGCNDGWRSSPPADRPDSQRMFPGELHFLPFMADHEKFAFTPRDF